MKIGVIGCTGRMGKEVVQEVLRDPTCALAAATTRQGNFFSGKDISNLIGTPDGGVIISDNVDQLCAVSDAIIDFTSPDTSLALAELNSSRYKKIHIIGTTGFTVEEKNKLQTLSRNAVIVWSANMSLGINVMMALVKQAAKVLSSEDFDIEILEMHHNEKKDAPSGTSLMLGNAIADIIEPGATAEKLGIFDRKGLTGARPKNKLGFATLRGGDVVGEHTIIFAGQGERIEISHKASQRSMFAKGAIKAALWARNQQPGLYSMADVIADR